ncbi:SPJ_0845 family protein [Paucilactobacillus nenjiangensis]|jgi:hypothetical protein|nr:SPJ_0845 family protein [Paucilactobacillus nenjiangensis]
MGLLANRKEDLDEMFAKFASEPKPKTEHKPKDKNEKETKDEKKTTDK